MSVFTVRRWLWRHLQLLILCCPIVSIAEVVPMEIPSYQGSVELGIIHTTGNVHTQFNYWRAYAVNERNVWRLYGNIGGNSTYVNDERVAERYDAFAQSDYKLFDEDYLYVNVEYESDKYSGYSHRFTETFGFGHNFPKRGNLETKGELGLGVLHTYYTPGERLENTPIVNVKAVVIYRFKEETYLEQIVSTRAGEEIVTTMSETSLVQSFVKNFALKTSYTVMHASHVQPGIRDIDTVARVILVYSFDKR